MVTADPEEAVAALERGDPVVLIVKPDDTSTRARAGRLALMVGDPDDPDVRAAASQMEAELYGWK